MAYPIPMFDFRNLTPIEVNGIHVLDQYMPVLAFVYSSTIFGTYLHQYCTRKHTFDPNIVSIHRVGILCLVFIMLYALLLLCLSHDFWKNFAILGSDDCQNSQRIHLTALVLLKYFISLLMVFNLSYMNQSPFFNPRYKYIAKKRRKFLRRFFQILKIVLYLALIASVFTSYRNAHYEEYRSPHIHDGYKFCWMTFTLRTFFVTFGGDLVAIVGFSLLFGRNAFACTQRAIKVPGTAYTGDFLNNASADYDADDPIMKNYVVIQRMIRNSMHDNEYQAQYAHGHGHEYGNQEDHGHDRGQDHNDHHAQEQQRKEKKEKKAERKKQSQKQREKEAEELFISREVRRMKYERSSRLRAGKHSNSSTGHHTQQHNYNGDAGDNTSLVADGGEGDGSLVGIHQGYEYESGLSINDSGPLPNLSGPRVQRQHPRPQPQYRPPIKPMAAPDRAPSVDRPQKQSVTRQSSFIRTDMNVDMQETEGTKELVRVLRLVWFIFIFYWVSVLSYVFMGLYTTITCVALMVNSTAILLLNDYEFSRKYWRVRSWLIEGICCCCCWSSFCGVRKLSMFSSFGDDYE